MKKSDITIRPATIEDIREFWGEDIPKTIRAFVVECGGISQCIAGVYQHQYDWIVFSDMKENNFPKMTIWRAANMLMEKLKSLNLPLTAIPDECIERSGVFLERLGFIKQGSVYKWQS